MIGRATTPGLIAARARRWKALSALAVMVLVVILLPPASSAGLGTPTTFTDPTGDVSGAPDVTQVGVSHTVSRALTITVNVANEPVLLDQHVLELRFDTDMNASTGSGSGVELLIHRLWTGSTLLCTWTGAGFSCGSSSSVVSSYVNGLLTVTTTTQALGIHAGFDFSVAGYPAPLDFAPDVGSWRYLLGRASWWP